jgi:uncharacterized membrane protein YdbT with pleckstrin-like domain
MEDRVARGKKLLLYGMVALVLVTIISVFVSLWVITAPLGSDFTGVAVKTTLIVGVIAIVAAAVVWFIYTKAILKE